MLQDHLFRMADNLIRNEIIEQNQREGAINAMREEWQDNMAISFGVGSIQAVAAEFVPLDQQGPRAKTRRHYSRGQACRAAAEYNKVVVGCHV